MNQAWHKIYLGAFFITGITAAVLLGMKGYNYYTTPLEERFFLPEHNVLKPSGSWGHGLGIAGSVMMILGVAVYMARKYMRSLMRIGLLKHFLELHIFLCTLGPVLVLYHTAFKFGGLVAVSFWCMVAVVVSGVIGRFIYVQIPRSIRGKELDMHEINEINSDLTDKLAGKYNISCETLQVIEQLTSADKYRRQNLGKSTVQVFSDYFQSRSLLQRLNGEMNGRSAEEKRQLRRLIKTKIVLAGRIGRLSTMQKLFKYWHIAHMPFAIIMLIIMLIHVAVAIAFGYRWIF